LKLAMTRGKEGRQNKRDNIGNPEQAKPDWAWREGGVHFYN